MKVSNLTYCTDCLIDRLVNVVVYMGEGLGSNPATITFTDCLIGRLVNVVVYMGEGLGSNPATITLTLLIIDSPPI